ncbi:ABATE domain-containing protein [Actinomadura sp. BRA 177]|uniref:CGNR zinc finger domain-containing protein n=1 Tax=Actinomadura sp. BRA 177 TaxID=2745202 RepID=UPI0015954BA1|nr:CGNR zinc finger domain-containing protein [Actinomadura sp. BRA 177]NVI92127.1 CGNR zinc finger domain-containing protein [Actinomadura sp. BRA 177]
MNLASYADLAIDLVNTRRPDGDDLRDLDGLRALLAHRPHFGGRIAHRDLDAMRELRTQLRAIFAAAARGDEDGAVDRLNTMLIHHPVHPQVSRHDGQDWHLHFNEAGSVPDRYASRAAMGLAAKIAAHGLGRLGTCRAEGCERVFFDTTANGSRRHCSDRCAGRPSVTAACHPTSPRVTVPARETDR